MSAKQFCLKWNSFQTNILSAFESLQNTEDLADVTLTCEGLNLKAHKFILSACSPYFRTVFKENPCSHPIVILKDVTYRNLIAIVNFMYHGEVLVSEEQLSSFLQTAMILQVSGLINNECPPKKNVSTHKKPKTQTSDMLSECPLKKAKLSPKPKKIIPSNDDSGSNNATKDTQSKFHDNVETEKIKIESYEISDVNEQFCGDVNENMEIIETEKSDQQGSILEAALEVRDKPSSILERSLMSHNISGKSPSSIPYSGDQLNVLQVLPDIPKTVFIPRKPPEMEERSIMRSSSESSSPSTFDRPSEILQQSIKIEGEPYENTEVLSPDDMRECGYQVNRGIDVQPHHSSQCGNCPHCGKVYSNQSALKYHVRLVHSDLTNMYCCHLCPESFDYREGYKKHMAEVHCIRN